MNTNTPDRDKATNESKRSLPSFRDAKPVPPEHPIYKRGPQFGFVGALPASLLALQKKKK